MTKRLSAPAANDTASPVVGFCAIVPALVSVTPPVIAWVPASIQVAPASTATWPKPMNCVPKPDNVPAEMPVVSSSVLETGNPIGLPPDTIPEKTAPGPTTTRSAKPGLSARKA